MSDLEPTRDRALELAVSYHRNEGGTSAEIVETARAFLEFLAADE